MRTRCSRAAPAGILVMLLIVSAAGGDRTPDALVSSVIGSAGSPASGAGIVANGTAGQPTPIGVCSGNGIVLHAGFWGPLWGSVTGVTTPGAEVLATALQNAYPNPFNPQTRIEFTIAAPCLVRLEIFDAMGRHVATLVDDQRPAGRYQVSWEGTDTGGRRVASGLYFYRLRAGDHESVKKMSLVK
jgi:hypothetical protein